MTKECRKTRREFDRVKRVFPLSSISPFNIVFLKKTNSLIVLLIEFQNNFSYTSSQASSRHKVIKKIAKRCAAVAVFIGRNPEETLW